MSAKIKPGTHVRALQALRCGSDQHLVGDELEVLARLADLKRQAQE